MLMSFRTKLLFTFQPNRIEFVWPVISRRSDPSLPSGGFLLKLGHEATPTGSCIRRQKFRCPSLLSRAGSVTYEENFCLRGGWNRIHVRPRGERYSMNLRCRIALGKKLNHFNFSIMFNFNLKTIPHPGVIYKTLKKHDKTWTFAQHKFNLGNLGLMSPSWQIL